MKPGREQWWWRDRGLKRTLNGSPALDHYFYWKVRGRKSPDGTKWSPAQRRNIEVGLWLYELDARVSKKYLFGKPAHRLSAKQLASIVDFAPAPMARVEAPTGGRRRPYAWVWIEYFDKRNAQTKQAAKLTRAEMNGIIAAMKFCLEHFTHG